MIILEGCDGSGKTTLGKQLLQAKVVDTFLPSPRITAKGDGERMKYETERYIRLYGENNRIAVDRFLFSEMAYGKIIRGKPLFSKGDYLHKLVQLMVKGSIVVFCLPERLHFKQDESEFLISKMPEIRAIYDRMVDEQALTSPKTYIYRWDEPDAFSRLIQFIEEMR